MRRSAEFEQAVRRGVRSGTTSLVVHLTRDPDATSGAHVGFVVARSVGNAVARNRVKRRLRAVVSHRIDQLPEDGRLVVRALPGSAEVDSAVLTRDFERALAGARRRLEGRSAARASSGRGGGT
jgi:ribonuclease P protein component